MDSIEEMDYDEAVSKELIKEIYPLNEYLDNIINAVDMQKIRNAGLRVALDPMYGVSEIPLKTLLLTARCDVETIHDRHDTLFGGKLPSPSASTLRGLMTRVIDYGFDIGIGYRWMMRTELELLMIQEDFFIQMTFLCYYIIIL